MFIKINKFHHQTLVYILINIYILIYIYIYIYIYLAKRIQTNTFKITFSVIQYNNAVI